LSSTLVGICRIDDRTLAKSEKRVVFAHQDKNDGRYSVRGNMMAVFCLPTGDHWTVRGRIHCRLGNEKPLKGTIGIDRSAALRDKRGAQVLP
jgi:hypothetical protein